MGNDGHDGQSRGSRGSAGRRDAAHSRSGQVGPGTRDRMRVVWCVQGSQGGADGSWEEWAVGQLD